MRKAQYLTTTAPQGDGDERRVLQVELDVASSSSSQGVGFAYSPGDAVGVRCPNREGAVAVVLAR